MINKYLYAEATQDYWPTMKSIMANSYNDAVEKLINTYSTNFEDDAILELDNIKSLQEYLNDNYDLAISDLEICEEI